MTAGSRLHAPSGTSAWGYIRWVVLPLASFGIAATLGQVSAAEQRRGFFDTLPDEAEQRELQTSVKSAIADAVWTFGAAPMARQVQQSALAQLQPTGELRARLLMRLALLEDDDAASGSLLRQACAADTTLCDDVQREVQRQAAARVAETELRRPSINPTSQP